MVAIRVGRDRRLDAGARMVSCRDRIVFRTEVCVDRRAVARDEAIETTAKRESSFTRAANGRAGIERSRGRRRRWSVQRRIPRARWAREDVLLRWLGVCDVDGSSW